MQYTGEIGSWIIISGSGINRISEVRFGSIPAAFREDTAINSNFIRAKVPREAYKAKIQVVSSERGVSAQSENDFVPKPVVTGFCPLAGIPGDTIIISGYAFSGITGIQFNNLNATGFTVLSNSGIIVPAPTGNTKGYIKVMAESGLFGLSPNSFCPLAKVTGMSTTIARTGEEVDILGINFNPDIMFEVTTNNYLVGFNNATGAFERINDTILRGQVPELATSGQVYVYQSSLDLIYPTEITFNVIPPNPIITGAIPSTGKIGDLITIRGENFVGSNSITLSGYDVTGVISGISGNVTTLNDLFYFSIPTINQGLYNVILNASGGSATGSGILRVLESGVYSGITPSTGIQGDIIRASGLNLYATSNVYINNILNKAVITGISSGNDYIDFIIPNNVKLTSPNTIIINNGVNTVSGINALSIYRAPEISGFTPISGRVTSTNIILSGRFLTTTSLIKINNYSITGFSITGDTGIYFQITTGVTSSGPIRITTTGGTGITSLPFILLPEPIEISGFTPNSVLRGSTVLLSGKYLNSVTGITLSGKNGNDTIPVYPTFFSTIGTTGLVFDIPPKAIDGKIKLSNITSETTSTGILNIKLPPIISGYYPKTGRYNEKLFISGDNFSNIKVLFEENTSQGASISNKRYVEAPLYQSGYNSGTYLIPREVLSGPIYVSGNGEITSQSVSGFSNNYHILPSIYGINKTIFSGYESLTITGINCSNLASGYLLMTGSNGSLNNIVNPNNPTGMIINSSGVISGSGYTIITALIYPTYAGTGNLSLESTGILTGGYTGVFNSSGFFGNQVLLSGQYPQITGVYPPSGGETTVVRLSGLHLSQVTGIQFLSMEGQFPTYSGFITHLTPELLLFSPMVTHEATAEVPEPDLNEDLYDTINQMKVQSLFGVNDTYEFTTIAKPSITGLQPLPRITGQMFSIRGTGLRYTTGVFLRDSAGYETEISFTKQPGDIVRWISGVIPTDITLSSQDMRVVIKSVAGTGTSPEAIRIQNIRDINELDELEAKIYLIP